MKKDDTAVTVITVILFLASFAVLKISEFSVLSLVNFQNYFIETMIVSTIGMGTLEAVNFAIQPFLLVLVSLLLFVAGLSVLAAYGFKKEFSGLIPGAIGAVVVVVLFQTVAGAFFALAVFLSSFLTPNISSVYGRELKRWIPFRVGTSTVGKVMRFSNLIIVLGILSTVLLSQSFYEQSFKSDLSNSMKTIAISIPGAEMIPSDMLEERISSLIDESPMLEAYTRWMPVTTAFGAWVTLEFLRSVLLANVSGLFTFLILKTSK